MRLEVESASGPLSVDLDGLAAVLQHSLHAILCIHDDESWGPPAQFSWSHLRVGDHNHPVPRGDALRGRPIDTERARPGCAFDTVRDHPLTVVHVEDMHLFIGGQVRRLHELGIEREAARVFDVGLRHGRAMDF